MSTETPVWFITGCSTGFGRELAQYVLARGYKAVITARNTATLSDIAERHPQQLLLKELDVNDSAQVDAVVEAAVSHFGRIDVLVNNAGFGYFGSFEDSELNEARRMFETNFWGLVSVTRSVLPTLRKQRRGTIINFSSIGGIVAFPALSFYNATKFAVEGASESLAQEVAPLGIKVLLVEPGPFRTDWAGRSANEAPTLQDDYKQTAGARIESSRGYSGKQPGDPVRAAAAIVNAVESDTPPKRLLLGKAALTAAKTKIAAMTDEINAWEDVTLGADFPEGK